MERLTEKHEADAQRKEYERRLANGYPRNIPEERFLRLAAYEDTGLTPENIAKAKDALEYAYGNAERIIELAKADKDGRLVVLPCKVGDTVWVTGRDNVPREMRLEKPDIRTVCADEDNLCMATCNRKPDGFCAYRLRNDGADIGQTVFLTREEAEKALEGKRNG
mgnify:CR=1 FL=1